MAKRGFQLGVRRRSLLLARQPRRRCRPPEHPETPGLAIRAHHSLEARSPRPRHRAAACSISCVRCRLNRCLAARRRPNRLPAALRCSRSWKGCPRRNSRRVGGGWRVGGIRFNACAPSATNSARPHNPSVRAPQMSLAPRPRHLVIEPLAHVVLESDAVHVVVQRLLQRGAEQVVVDARRVGEADVVVGEWHVRRRMQA